MRMMMMGLGQLNIPMGESRQASTEPIDGTVFRPTRLIVHLDVGPVRDIGRFYLVARDVVLTGTFAGHGFKPGEGPHLHGIFPGLGRIVW